MNSVLLERARQEEDGEALIREVPYAALLGMRYLRLGEERRFHLPANPDCIGNPLLPALHGGVIAGFMEHAALVHLLLAMPLRQFPQVIDFSVDYLRAGQLLDTYARCRVWRQGRRVANVAVNAWQATEDEPIATARVHFKLDGGAST